VAEDYIRPVRRAALPCLKVFDPLLELIPAASMFPGTVPASRTLPFLRFGTMIGTPFLASGLDSASIRFSVQAFSQALMQAGAEVSTAEDQILMIGSVVKDALDNQTLTLENGMKVRIQWVTSSPRRDGDEEGAWMTTVTFIGEVSA
jgi:hypothetical protein